MMKSAISWRELIIKGSMDGHFYERCVRVQSVFEETPETKSFSLDLAGESIRFVSGQFVNVTVELGDKHRVRRAFIAGGSGIVPFRSMWRYLRQTGSQTKFRLLYASKSLRHVIYRDELRALMEAGFQVVFTFTRNDDPFWTGYSRRIDRDMLVEFAGDFTHRSDRMCRR